MNSMKKSLCESCVESCYVTDQLIAKCPSYWPIKSAIEEKESNVRRNKQ
jgi:hypothetical protein